MITFEPFRYLDRPVADCTRRQLNRLVAEASPALALEGMEIAMRELAAFCDVRRDPLPGAVIVDRCERTLHVISRFGHQLRVRCDQGPANALMLSDWMEVAHDATVLADPFAGVVGV